MPKEVFDQLRADMEKLAEHINTSISGIRDTHGMDGMFQLFHEVNAQRSYDSSHPRWRTQTRVLPPSHVWTRSWISELYDRYYLNDDHIRTALKKIMNDSAKT